MNSVLLFLPMAFFAADTTYILYTGGSDFWGNTRANFAYPLIAFLLLNIVRLSVKHWSISPRKLFTVHATSILFSLVFIVYLSNGKTIGSPDSIPARYLPVSVLRDGNWYLDRKVIVRDPENPPYFVKFQKGHLVSAYPVGAALLAVPLYVIPAIGPTNGHSIFWRDLEKLPAAVFVSLSVLLLYLTLSRITRTSYAVLLSLIYAFATSSFSISSQAQWQHGASQLSLCAAFYCLVRKTEDRWIWFAGLPLSMSIVCRPTDFIMVAFCAMYIVFYHPRQVIKAILMGLPPLFFQLSYNYTYFGNVVHTQFDASGSLWRTPFFQGLAGILVSPGRGLFIYSPIFIFSFVGIFLLWNRRTEWIVLRFLSIGSLLSIVLYSYWSIWWGGVTFGPRLIADLCPALTIFLYPVLPLVTAKRLLRILFLIAGIWSVTAHAIGVYLPDLNWNLRYKVDSNPQALWQWQDNQLVNPVVAGYWQVFYGIRGYPNSISSPDLLKASYTLKPSPCFSIAGSNGNIRISVTAQNQGKAVWIAKPQGEKGTVQICWNWTDGEDENCMPLEKNVLLNDLSDFALSVPYPSKPGNYTMQLDMQSVDLRNFELNGSAPLILNVRVAENGRVRVRQNGYACN